MSSAMSSLAVKALRPAIPYLRYLPKPILTLVPTLALHLNSHPSPNPLSFFLDPLTHPLHAPILLTFCVIPLIYTLGLLTGNVSWVDRSWPFYTPICSTLIFLWAIYNPSAEVYAHNLPRIGCMLFLQAVWSMRLTRHAIRRDFYDLTSEDYRYTQFRKIVPWWFFQFVHLFVIAIAQPLLLLSLSLPLHSILVLPPTELASGPFQIHMPISEVSDLLPKRYQASPGDTPIITLYDIILVVLGLGIILVEHTADDQMYEYQTSKHDPATQKNKDNLVIPKSPKKSRLGPKAAAYPKSHYPGFITTGLFRYSRHPNFAAEQLFWVNQALFVAAAGRSSGITRSGWVSSSVFGPCFALSCLFCASTFLTEWITEKKYPVYKSYRQVTGQFLPQETVMVNIIAYLRGRRDVLRREVFGGSKEKIK